MSPLALVSALWLGILTSISPCPLATNVAAMSFVGKRVGDPRHVVLSGALYCLGRVLAYAALAAVLVAGLLSVPTVAGFLQRYMNILLGPLLILTGMVLLQLIPMPSLGVGAGGRVQAVAERGGLAGALILGLIFALAFCPVSAALFFGSLIPLSVRHQSTLWMPALYGIGTGLPVAVFALLIALGARSLGQVFRRVSDFDRWARGITGVVFIAVGIHETLRHIFGVSLWSAG